MKILIIPSVRETYKNQFEYCTDLKLIKFLKQIFYKPLISIYNNEIEDKYDLLIFAGGNNSINLKKKDRIREKINNKIYNYALTKKIAMIGICHGAQFISKKFGFKIKEGVGKIGNHNVLFNINKRKFYRSVNSYHDDVIKIKNIKSVNIFAISGDNYVEGFHVKEKKILGIMWHPERYVKFKIFDKKIIKKFYATNSISSW